MNNEEIANLLREAHYNLKLALGVAPKKSNLSDDLDRLCEEVNNLHNAVTAGEFDDTGMAR